MLSCHNGIFLIGIGASKTYPVIGVIFGPLLMFGYPTDFVIVQAFQFSLSLC